MFMQCRDFNYRLRGRYIRRRVWQLENRVEQLIFTNIPHGKGWMRTAEHFTQFFADSFLADNGS
jgi:hypothetical protein